MTNERSLVEIGEEIADELNTMFPEGELGSDAFTVLNTLIKAHRIEDEKEIKALRIAVKDALKRLRPSLPIRRAS
jgi:hypothetical protein